MLLDFLQFLGLDGDSRQDQKAPKKKLENIDESEIIECEKQEYKTKQEETIINENGKTIKITKTTLISPIGGKKAMKQVQISKQEISNGAA